MSFPSLYMFKFIVPADNRKLALLENIFGSEASLQQKSSSGGKYISITAKQIVMSVEEIVNIYRKANEIEGVIWL